IRQPNSVASPVRRARLQDRPPSLLTSTLTTLPVSPLHAAPRTRIRFPTSSFAPFVGNAMTLFTRRRVTGLIASGGTTVPGATCLLGYRYAFFIQNPSYSSFSTRTEVTHLTQK